MGIKNNLAKQQVTKQHGRSRTDKKCTQLMTEEEERRCRDNDILTLQVSYKHAHKGSFINHMILFGYEITIHCNKINDFLL